MSLTAILDSDGTALRAPAPGWFHRRVAPDHLILEGDVIGELEILGRLHAVIAPRVRGLAKLPTLDLRRAVGYGDVLVRVEAAGAIEATTPDAHAPAETSGLVFRAPTSGRFYGRAAPDKPPFVAPGAELATGATICLLEVMKTFHRVTYTGAAARVRDVLVADGADVTAGDALLALDPI